MIVRIAASRTAAPKDIDTYRRFSVSAASHAGRLADAKPRRWIGETTDDIGADSEGAGGLPGIETRQWGEKS